MKAEGLENGNLSKHLVKTNDVLRPEVPQDGPKRAPGIILGVWMVARRPIWGPSWAHLGPSLAFFGGPGGHPEADLGHGRLHLGVQDGQNLRCQKPVKKQ